MSDSAMDEAVDSGTETPPVNWSLHQTTVASMATRATFLAVFLILGVVGNCVLVATIAQSNRLKGRVLNLYIISIALVNLVDCFGNLPLILGSTIKQQWDYGQIACQINAFGLHLVSLAMISGLMLMTLDRFLGVRQPDKHTESFSVTKANVFIVYSWIQSTALSFPLLLNSVQVDLFYNRYLCSIKFGAPLVYLVFLSVLGYIVPVFLIIGFDVYIIQRGAKEKVRVKKLDHNFSGSIASDTRLWTEINAAKYVGVLFVLWCIFQGPYLLMSAVQQYRTTINIYLNFEFSVPWEVELAFTWMKLSYPIYLPIVTFGWQKEVWQKFKNCILCRKSNLILDASPKSTPEHRKGNGDAINRKDNTVLTGVPVIFATENGLHIQTYGQDEYSDSELNEDIGVSKLDGSHMHTARKCDVMGSQDLMQMDEDTSDYDSSGEIDPFSSSNPISVRTEYEGGTKGSIHLTKTTESTLNEMNNEPQKESMDISRESSEIVEVIAGKNSPLQNKKKKKKKKKEFVESVIYETEHDNEVDPSARYDRASHDSGRGSMEDRSKNHKEKKIGKEDIDNSEGKSEGISADQECETNIDDLADNASNKGRERKLSQTSAGTNSIEVKECTNDQPKVKKKKKKKKLQREENVEMTEQTKDRVVDDTLPVKDVGDKRRPLPPRLNPIEIERSSMISSKPLNPPPKLPGVSSRSHSRKISDQYPTLSSVDDRDADTASKSHQRSYSESQVSDTEVSQRPIPAKRSKSRISLTEAEPKPKPRLHKRTGTTDSQTHLLSSSNNSSDLSEINNYINSGETDAQQPKLFTPAKTKRKLKTAADHSKDITIDSDVSPR